MLKVEMTHHAKTDRLDRLVECNLKIGIGDIILTAQSSTYGRDTMRCLTDTGIILIMSMDGKTLVTGYMGNMSQVVSIYRENGIERIPNSMYKRVKSNNKKFAYLLQM